MMVGMEFSWKYGKYYLKIEYILDIEGLREERFDLPRNCQGLGLPSQMMNYTTVTNTVTFTFTWGMRLTLTVTLGSCRRGGGVKSGSGRQVRGGRGGGADEKVGKGGGVQIVPQRGAFANVHRSGRPGNQATCPWITPSECCETLCSWLWSTRRDNAARVSYVKIYFGIW